METSFSWERGNPEPAVECYTDDPAWRAKLLRIARENPDRVMIKVLPEDNDGAIIIKVPVEFVQIRPKRRVNMTDERKSALAEQLRKMNEARRPEAEAQNKQEEE